MDLSVPSNNTDYCILPFPGDYGERLAFDWDYNTSDGPFCHDKFGYVVDGVFTQLTNDAGYYPKWTGKHYADARANFCLGFFNRSGFWFCSNHCHVIYLYGKYQPNGGAKRWSCLGSCFPLGTTTNTFTVTDNNNTPLLVVLLLTVEDTEDPTIECLMTL